MRSAWVIAWRDFRAAFDTPLAYVLNAAFCGISGLLFLTLLHDFSSLSDWARSQAAEDPSLLEHYSLDVFVVRQLLRFLSLLLLVLVPLLTMKLLAEEERQGTLELLLTAPVSPATLVLGKFLAGFLLALVPLLLTAWYPLVLLVVGRPDSAALLGGYLGVILVAAAFTAVGLFASALTDSPLLAAFLGFVFLLVSVFAGIVGAVLPPELGGLVGWFSVLLHYEPMVTGVIDTGDLAFFACFTGALLFLTHRVIDSRRWR